MRRDFEIIPLSEAKDRLFGHNLTKYEYEKLLKSDRSWLRIMYRTPDPSESPSDGLKYYIRYGAPIDNKLIKAFQSRGIKYIPVVFEGDQSAVHAKLSNFAKEHSAILMGQIYGCVREWLNMSGKSLERKIDQFINTQQGELGKALIPMSNDLGHLVSHVIQEILAVTENLSVVALYEELIDDIRTYFSNGAPADQYQDEMRHNLEVTILSIILGSRCKLEGHRLSQLGLAALLHDMGMIVSFEKCREAFLDKKVSPWSYDLELQKYRVLHPIYGAVLLSDSEGETIEGLEQVIRHVVLQHQQYLDGSGHSLYLEEFEHVMKSMNIQPDTAFYGFNKMPSNVVQEERYKLCTPDGQLPDKSSRRLSMPAQILSIIEHYVTYTEELNQRTALEQMIPYVGNKFNGPIFEIFFNSMVPIEHFPDGAILKMKMKEWHPAYEYNNYSVLLQTRNNKKVFMLFKDQNDKYISPKEVTLDLLKGGVILRLGDWK